LKKEKISLEKDHALTVEKEEKGQQGNLTRRRSRRKEPGTKGNQDAVLSVEKKKIPSTLPCEGEDSRGQNKRKVGDVSKRNPQAHRQKMYRRKKATNPQAEEEEIDCT